jgi:ABC-type transport system involved in multi-copper enzyme maturation permease subunit
LSTITALLGLSTLWLACGTLARDIEDCTLQVVAIKPIARWQIWLGKWVGIMSLNAALLGLSGASVYGLLQWRATRLPAAEQKVLREEVLVARGSAKPASIDKEIQAATDRVLQERLQKNPGIKANIAEARKQILEEVKAEYQVVPPGWVHEWEINLGNAKNISRGQPLYLRIKFNSADHPPSGTFDGRWRVGVPRKTQLWHSESMSLAPDTFHEFEVPAYYDDKGLLTVAFANANESTLLFPLEDGMEVLYRQGGFGLNYTRGLGIIFCWMALLATLGLAAASFLSFPVAAFLSLAVLTLALSSGTIANAVSEGTLMGFNSETSQTGHSPLDVVAIPVFRAVLELINLAKNFSPIDSLSTGRSVSWGDLAQAFGQIVVLLGGSIGLAGILVFNRRELATAQGQ